jgi:excisionase family DNA binding protein
MSPLGWRGSPLLNVRLNDIGQLPAALTVAEAAELLRVSPRHLRELIARGEIESLRLGRRVLIPRVPLLRKLGIEESNGSR